MESISIKNDPEPVSRTNNKDETDEKIIENVVVTEDDASLCSQEKLKLSSWGLPPKVLDFYESKKIINMFQWQLECLSLSGVLDAGNLVYSAPTSAGKTLVAEILISKTLFEIQKKALVILPFVSVVREKMFYFQGMFASSGIHVEGYMGGHSPSISFKQVHLAVCTIEKANSIINKLLEEQNLDNLGLVVVDELHLLGDPYRGYLLELLLTKLLYISQKSNFQIQIVGMSATLPNLKSLANWLQASLYYTDFRPVPLKEKLKCGNTFYDKQLSKLYELEVLPFEAPDDSENVGQLCLETIANGHSVLIFCPTKVWCETLAEKISVFFQKNGCHKSAETEGTPGWILRKQLNLKKINKVIEHLKMCPVGLDQDLHKTVAYGVAFHHAGLTLDERDIIEGSFRQGSLRVLCATSTLSSGVNLPARRVIIRSPMSFGGLMDILTYRQMIGRAGRMGVDSEGESILISKPNEKHLCQNLMCLALKPIESCLGHGRLSASLKRALLEIIASGVAATPEDVNKYANCTYLAFSSKHDIEDPLKSCIDFLEENEFIRLQENGSVFAPTPLGKACLASSLPPDEGLALFQELQRARRCFVLDTDLHIIYQVTPYSVSEQWSKIDWLNMLNILESLPPSMKRVGEMVGVEESFLVRVAKGMININIVENRHKLSIHRRFYTALALQDLINEIPLTDVAKKFECNKGMLQSLQQSAATYAGMVTEFTKCLGWNSVELIFSQFQERLQFGIRRELCELMRLPLLNAMRARVIYNAGFTNLITLANANILDLENVFFSMVPFQSKKEIAGETSYDKEQRNKLETIWITGKANMSIHQAAELLVREARNIIELEFGLENAKWGKREDSFSNSIENTANKSTIYSKSNKSALENALNNTSPTPSLCLKRNANIVNNTKHDKNSKEIETSNIKAIVCEEIKISNMKAIEVLQEIVSPKNKEKIICDKNSVKECMHVPDIKNDRAVTDKEKVIEKTYIGTKNNSLNQYVISSEKSEIKKLNNDCELSISSLKGENIILSSSSIKKEDFNFTSSYIFEMVPNYLTERLGDLTSENREVNNSKDTEFGCSDNDSIDLAEAFYSSQIQNNSKVLSISRLSEDMFDKENPSSKKQSTPIHPPNLREASESNINKNRLAEISSPDLFSQSLTFDTQLGKILDFEEPPLHEIQPRAIPSSSFNSDDLGFVSDLSPPRQNLRCIQNQIKSTKVKDTNVNKHSGSLMLKINTSFSEKKLEPIKRKADKIDSPDLIVDSDESALENQHISKRKKHNAQDWDDNLKELPCTSIVNESDDEIMPTPKLDKIHLSTFSNIRKLHDSSFNRNFCSRGSQRSRLISLKSKTNYSCNTLRKSKCESIKSQISRIRASLTGNSRPDKLQSNRVNVVDVCEKEEDFTVFCEKLNEQNIVGLALGCRRKIQEKKNLIGSRVLKKRKSDNSKFSLSDCQYNDIILDGIAFYWKGNNVAYMSLDDRILPLVHKIKFLKNFCNKNKTVRAYDVKEQIKMLKRCCSFSFSTSCQDPKVASWLLSETLKPKNFSAIVSEFLPGAKALISQIGGVVGYSSPGLLSKSSVSHRTRACIEAYLTYHVIEQQLPLLYSKGLEQAFFQTEMPIMLCLADLELAGFQICKDNLIKVKNQLDNLKESLEQKAYSLAGHKFSMSSSVAISNVLQNDLKLEIERVPVTKKRKLLSISKQALTELAEETNHPLPEIILQWRKIRSILSKFLAFLLQCSMDSQRIFGVCQTYTATGRISMHEPNLQNIPKAFEVSDGDKESILICLRDIFVAAKNCVLISADYCQIELRILAHLSEDKELIKNICESPDIFVSIAANVFGVPQYEVDETLRSKAKQIIYGIIYGMGPKTLSQQLKVKESDAITLIENFKNKYLGLKYYLEKIVAECKKNGYVTTLLKRRRYLPEINNSNPALQTEAERMAINTTIQGSAADFIKTAMISWKEKVDNIMPNEVVIYPVLHLHDELIFEVQKDAVEEVAAVLKETMEEAMKLNVPTPVKIKTGDTWGQLKCFEF